MLLSNSVHFSSERGNWETPQDFFDKLNEEFRFTLDVCAEKHTAKCEKYFTKELLEKLNEHAKKVYLYGGFDEETVEAE